MNLNYELVFYVIIDQVLSIVFVVNLFQDETLFVKLILSFISGSAWNNRTTFLVHFVL